VNIQWGSPPFAIFATLTDAPVQFGTSSMSIEGSMRLFSECCIPDSFEDPGPTVASVVMPEPLTGSATLTVEKIMQPTGQYVRPTSVTMTLGRHVTVSELDPLIEATLVGPILIWLGTRLSARRASTSG